MKICFVANGTKSGLDLNGGSRTIVKSAETLIQLGHEVSICATHNKYTWGKVPNLVRSVTENTDALVAVSCKDVKNVLKHPCKRKHWWMRGIETWAMPEEKLLERASRISVIVNAGHLKEWLLKRGVKSQLCFAGLDLSLWETPSSRQKNNRVRIGCLYHSRHLTKRWSDFAKLAEALGRTNYEYVGFGVGKPNDVSWLADYKDQPSVDRLIHLYQSCDIWFAPTTSEGFHNVCAEASLCGCLALCNTSRHSGMADYADSSTAMMYGTIDWAAELCKNPDFDLVPRMQEKLHAIGDRKQNMERLIQLCQ